MTLSILPLPGLPEVRPGDDLVSLLAPALEAAGVLDGDVVVVTSKIVSKAEGRLIAGDARTDAIRAETRRVVARRGDLVITETAHGFVCANAGVDASNIEAGTLALLPVDPDGSARALRRGIAERMHVDVGVVVTDTFGRAWRTGLVNVAIGCAGLPAVVDLRGTADHFGRPLDVTVVALADEVAAASGLVMAKAAHVPAAIVRGVERGGAPDGTALDLLRPPDEDLFRESPLRSLQSLRDAVSFGAGTVAREPLQEAVRAACAALAPHDPPPWRFDVLMSEAAKRGLRAALRGGTRDGTLESAPVLIVASVHGTDPQPTPTAGVATQSLLLALHAQGLAAHWAASASFDDPQIRTLLGTGDGWFAMGLVACGPVPQDEDIGTPAPVELDGLMGWH